MSKTPFDQVPNIVKAQELLDKKIDSFGRRIVKDFGLKKYDGFFDWQWTDVGAENVIFEFYFDSIDSDFLKEFVISVNKFEMRTGNHDNSRECHQICVEFNVPLHEILK